MKHPVRDRILMILCALALLSCTAAAIALLMGYISLAPAVRLLDAVNAGAAGDMKTRIALGVIAFVDIVLALMFFSAVLPSKKKRSSNFAVQKNENGMVRISLKAIESLVSKCLNQHAELKVVTSSLYSDEESIRIDVHVHLQSDISMPLAISALQKQIKRYIEACSGVTVQEVRIFVDGTLPSDPNTNSPYAIPSTLLGLEPEALPGQTAAQEHAEEPACEPVEEVPACEPETPAAEEAASDEEPEKAAEVESEAENA